mgnify:CR=1 FL=1
MRVSRGEDMMNASPRKARGARHRKGQTMAQHDQDSSEQQDSYETKKLYEMLKRLAELDDPMDALQFCDDPTFPVREDAKALARKIWAYFSPDRRSDSLVDDMLELLDEGI